MSSRGSYNSLFARPAAATNQADHETTDEPDGLVIDLTLLESLHVAPRERARPPARPSRRSLWLAVRPVATDSTRAVPPGLFSLTAPASRGQR